MCKTTVMALTAVFLVVALAAAVEPTPTPAPPTFAVKIVSPAAGERWVENTSQTVAWTLTPPATPTKVDLVLIVTVKDAVAPKEIVLATFENENPEKWVWDKVSPVGSKLKLEVRMQFAKMKPVKGSTVFDIVPLGVITATPPPRDDPVAPVTPVVPVVPVAPAPITVTAPNGGEVWTLGKPQLITWTIAPDKPVTLVKIYLSRDGGSTYPEVIAKEVNASLGQYKYVIKGKATLKAMVKIEEVTTKPVEGIAREFDVSDAPFTIANPKDKPTPEHQQN